MPAVSVIMNVFNGAATLREALESVLAQSFSDWELLVWDDCSTDESAQIVASFDDARIQYVRSPEQTSLGAARNAAIERATGKWLAFLDQDDIWEVNKLKLQMTLTQDDEAGLVYGRTLSFSRGGDERDHDYFHEFEALPEGSILGELLGRGCFVAMSSALLRRDAVLRAMPIPEWVRITPDYYLYLAVCGRYSARAVQNVVCRYRVSPGGMSSVFRRESLLETRALLEHWQTSLPENVYRRKWGQISTTLAVEELRTNGLRGQGLERLVRDGSVAWLMGRPMVWAGRALRRKVRTPYWKQRAKD